MRLALLALFAACTAPVATIANHYAAPPLPLVDTELESLAFLVGCWHHWSVDWGFDVCWTRDRNAWEGRYHSHGAMGPSSHTVLRVVRGDLGLTLTATGTCEATSDTTCETAFVAPPRVIATPTCERDRYTKKTCAVGGPLVMFGAGDTAVWLGRDVARDRLLFGSGYVTSMERKP